MSSTAPLAWFHLRPYAYQQEILDKLSAERSLHGRWRNLVVAATGTGKTVVAALDYARLAAVFAAGGFLPLRFGGQTEGFASRLS